MENSSTTAEDGHSHRVSGKYRIEGGEESKVIDSVHPQALWTVRQEGIYYFTPPDDKGRSTLCLYEFASSKTRKILETERRSPIARTSRFPSTDGPSCTADGKKAAAT